MADQARQVVPFKDRQWIPVRLDQIVIEPGFNCRVVDPSSKTVTSLAESIKAQGLLEPLHLGIFPELLGKLALIDGEHRFAACKLAGIAEVMCMVDTFASRDDAFMACVVKSQHRKRLRTYELAIACVRLSKAGFTPDVIAAHIGIQKSYVVQLLKIMTMLIPELLDLFRREDAETTVAKLILCCGLSPTDQRLEYEKMIYGREKEVERGAPPKKKRIRSGRTPTYIKSVIADLYAPEAMIKVRGLEKKMSEETRAACATLLRHLLGDIVEYPITISKR